MNTFALFDDATISPIVLGYYDPVEQPLRADPINITDPEIVKSANNGFRAAFLIMRGLGYCQARYCISYQFKEKGRSAYAHGQSAGLAFGLKFAIDAYSSYSGKPLGYSVAATGVVTEATQQAEVTRVEGINQKLKAAIANLKKGDKIFYPLDNDQDLEAHIKLQAANTGIELFAVHTVSQAVRRLFEKHPEEEYPVQIIGLGECQPDTGAYQIDNRCMLGKNLTVPFQIENNGRRQVQIEIGNLQPAHDWLHLSIDDTHLSPETTTEAQLRIKPRNRLLFWLRHFIKLSIKKSAKLSLHFNIQGQRPYQLSRHIDVNARFFNPWSPAFAIIIALLMAYGIFQPSALNKAYDENPKLLYAELTSALEQGRYLEAKKEIDDFLKRSSVGNDRIAKLSQELTDRLYLDINFGYRTSGKNTREAIESLPPGQIVLRSGDGYLFEFTADDDCFLYVYLLDSDQKLVQLFPNADVAPERNPVQTGKSYRIPAGEDWFVLDDKSGRETIYFVASRWPAQDLDQLSMQLIESDDFKEEQQINQKLFARVTAYQQAYATGLEGCFYKEFSFLHE